MWSPGLVQHRRCAHSYLAIFSKLVSKNWCTQRCATFGVTSCRLVLPWDEGIMAKDKFMAYLRVIGLELVPDSVIPGPCLSGSLLLLGVVFSVSSFLSSGPGNFDYSSGDLQWARSAGQWTCDGRGGGHSLSDRLVWATGGGERHPSQRAPVCRHEPELASQCFR